MVVRVLGPLFLRVLVLRLSLQSTDEIRLKLVWRNALDDIFIRLAWVEIWSLGSTANKVKHNFYLLCLYLSWAANDLLLSIAKHNCLDTSSETVTALIVPTGQPLSQLTSSTLLIVWIFEIVTFNDEENDQNFTKYLYNLIEIHNSFRYLFSTT